MYLVCLIVHLCTHTQIHTHAPPKNCEHVLSSCCFLPSELARCVQAQALRQKRSLAKNPAAACRASQQCDRRRCVHYNVRAPSVRVVSVVSAVAVASDRQTRSRVVIVVSVSLLIVVFVVIVITSHTLVLVIRTHTFAPLATRPEPISSLQLCTFVPYI